MIILEILKQLIIFGLGVTNDVLCLINIVKRNSQKTKGML